MKSEKEITKKLYDEFNKGIIIQIGYYIFEFWKK